jgi:hypothetical protein
MSGHWVGEAQVPWWRSRRKRGRHARDPVPISPSMAAAVLGFVLLACLILLLLTYL